MGKRIRTKEIEVENQNMEKSTFPYVLFGS